MKLAFAARPVRFFRQYFECGATQYGGMLAYSLLVSLIPVALGMLSIFGLVARNPKRFDLLRTMVVDVFPPDVRGPVHEALLTAGEHALLIILVSIAGLAWFSTGFFSTAGFALNQIQGWPSRGVISQRLHGLWLPPALALATTVGVGIDIGVRYFALPAWLGLIGLWIALTYLVYFLYRHAPSRRTAPHEALPGAGVAALGIVLFGAGLTVTANLTFHLGPDTRFFAAVFALTAWVYFIAQAILFGAVFNRYVADDRAAYNAGRRSEYVESQLISAGSSPSK